MSGLIRPYAGSHPVTQGFLGTYYNPTTGIGEPLGYVAPGGVRGKRAYVSGWTKHPHIHLAQDVAMAIGTDLLAPAAGRIIYEGYRDTGNFLFLLIHKDGTFQTGIYFNHIRSEGLLLPVGTRVAAGRHIAESGASGHVTGPHLHWEVRRGPASADPHYSSSWTKIDPAKCLIGGSLAGSSWLVPNV